MPTRVILIRHGETDAVIHAMECHHGDYDPHSVEAVLVTAADALSAARPGARREILENYIKRLEKLEGMATDFEGVEKAYAIQAGRELRIIVESDHISDEKAVWLARDVAKKVEAELKEKEYPFIGGARPFRDCEFAFVHPKKMNGVLLEVSGNSNRALYTGLAGAGNVLPALFPLLAGWVIGNYGFTSFFILFLLVISIAFFFIYRLRCMR